VPTPEVITYPQSGTYTIPAKTKVVTATETAVYPETTALVPGKTETYRGVTTIVEAETVATCPYVTVETSVGVSKVYETRSLVPTRSAPTPPSRPRPLPSITASRPSTLPGTYVQPRSPRPSSRPMRS
jgi:hypothetical protein